MLTANSNDAGVSSTGPSIVVDSTSTARWRARRMDAARRGATRPLFVIFIVAFAPRHPFERRAIRMRPAAGTKARGWRLMLAATSAECCSCSSSPSYTRTDSEVQVLVLASRTTPRNGQGPRANKWSKSEAARNLLSPAPAPTPLGGDDEAHRARTA